MNFLIVDDSSTILDTLDYELTLDGYNVLSARDGEEAWIGRP